KHLRLLRERIRNGVTALYRIGQRFGSAFENRIAFLSCQDVERAQQRETGIDQGRKLPCEYHQDSPFHLLPLEKREPGLALGGRDYGNGDPTSARSFCLSIAGRWRFPFVL